MDIDKFLLLGSALNVYFNYYNISIVPVWKAFYSNLYLFFMLLKLFMAFFGSKTTEVKYGPQMLSLFLC